MTTATATYESAVECLIDLKHEFEGDNYAFSVAVTAIARVFDKSIWDVREDVRAQMQPQQ